MRYKLLFPFIHFIGCFICCHPIFAQDSTQTKIRFVFDNTKMLKPSEKDTLEAFITKFYRDNALQITVFIQDTLTQEFASIDDFAKELANRRGIAQKNMANGVLLLILRKEGFINIMVGKGLEKKIPEEKAKLIIDKVLLPSFAEREFAKGISEAVKIMADLLKGNYEKQEIAEDTQKAETKEEIKETKSFFDGSFYWISFLLFAVLVGLYIIWQRKKDNKKKNTNDRFPELK